MYHHTPSPAQSTGVTSLTRTGLPMHRASVTHTRKYDQYKAKAILVELKEREESSFFAESQ